MYVKDPKLLNVMQNANQHLIVKLLVHKMHVQELIVLSVLMNVLKVIVSINVKYYVNFKVEAVNCETTCDTPVCDWKCKKPTDCKAPTCELKCQTPDCAK